MEWLLTETIQAGQESGTINEDSAKRVMIDTIVMEKSIAHPTVRAGEALKRMKGYTGRALRLRSAGRPAGK